MVTPKFSEVEETSFLDVCSLAFYDPEEIKNTVNEMEQKYSEAELYREIAKR